MTDSVVTDEMIEAAWSARVGEAMGGYEDWRVVIAAAIAAAPAVDKWVWCEEYGTPSRGPHAAKLVRIGLCPGPHRTILLGPEVAS